MKYLLDTHFLLWALLSPKNFSKKVLDILKNSDNIILVNALSFWEISLKFNSGKLILNNLLPSDLINLSLEIGFTVHDLTALDTASLYKLDSVIHKDPFDRLLIWIALNNNFTLLTDDKLIINYQKYGLKVIS